MADVVWSWSELCSALGLQVVDGPDVLGITNDSRNISSGDLFVALSGSPRPEFNIFEDSGRDGHDYIEDAVANGACGVLVHTMVDPDVQHLLVSDTLDAIWQCADHRRKQLSCPVVAVTGSSGKTTFKEFLAQVVNGTASEGSFNNHIGVPISLMRTPVSANNAIYEIGTNHPGEIKRLSGLVSPTIAVCLNVQDAHIGNFRSKDALLEEKLSIFSGLSADGVAVVPSDLAEATGHRLKQGQRLRTFGQESSCDVQFSVRSFSRVEISNADESVEVEIPGGGSHRAETLAAVACVLLELGKPLSDLSIKKYDLPPGRGRRFNLGRTILIDESYNANPSSMKAALAQFSDSSPVRKLAILGDMNELGERSDAFHADLKNHITGIDAIVTVGERIRKLTEVVPESQLVQHFDGANDDCLNWCLSHVRNYEVVLVKGSNTVFWTSNFCQKLVEKLGSKTPSSATPL